LIEFYFFYSMIFLAHPILSQNVIEVSGFYNPEWCFSLLKGEKWVTVFSGFCNPKTSKNRALHDFFGLHNPDTPKHPFSREKQFGLYNLNCISTNPKHVCNMYSHFRDNFNLPNSYPSILGHCYLFLVKNRVFGLLNRIAPKLPQKIRKLQRLWFRPIFNFL